MITHVHTCECGKVEVVHDPTFAENPIFTEVFNEQSEDFQREWHWNEFATLIEEIADAFDRGEL